MRGEEQTGSVRRGAGTPLHHQVFLVLRGAILSGQYAQAQLLPTEEELTASFGVSRVTIRKALAALRQDGLIERRQGVGTFVASGRMLERLHVPSADLLGHIRAVGASTQVKVLDVGWTSAPAHLQDFFQCDSDARLHRSVRLRSIGSRPIFHVVTYLPEGLGTGLTRSHFRQHSLYEWFTERGVTMTSGRQILSASLADPTLAYHLNTVVGAALVYIRRFHRDQHGRAAEYTELHATPQSFEVEMTLGLDELAAVG